jgi:hypothetical protein
MRDEAGHGQYRRRVLEARRARCVHLLCKEACTGVPEAHEREFAANPPIFWCDRTGRALGPDGGAATEARCGGTPRRCYEPPLRP